MPDGFFSYFLFSLLKKLWSSRDSLKWHPWRLWSSESPMSATPELTLGGDDPQNHPWVLYLLTRSEEHKDDHSHGGYDPQNHLWVLHLSLFGEVMILRITLECCTYLLGVRKTRMTTPMEAMILRITHECYTWAYLGRWWSSESPMSDTPTYLEWGRLRWPPHGGYDP